jgi:hypothetical protein
MKKFLGFASFLALVLGGRAVAADLSGKVVETMDAASYTYVLIDTGNLKSWAAAPQFAVKVGDNITISDEMPMRNYESKTLKRTFDVVYFTGSVRVNSQTPTAPAPKPAALPPGHPTAPTASNLAGISRADGGQTVAEIIAGKMKFAGQSITVRARVVKFNAAILGKNWLHLRDGSGAAGTNDLTVTTSANVKVGDLVLVTGRLSTDRDFGAGYTYPVIVEDATVTVQ